MADGSAAPRCRGRQARGHLRWWRLAAIGAPLAVIVGGPGVLGARAAPPPAQARLSSLRDVTVASLVAPNGDKTPYGIAVVPMTLGNLVAGHLLAVDFDNAAGVAAGGSTVLEVDPSTGQTSVFFTGTPVAGPVGVAINPLNDGVWIGDYGSLQDGTAANDLLILPDGTLKATFTNKTTSGQAVFLGVWGQGVSNVNGTVSFYWGNAGNATTGTGGGDVWRLTPHPAGPSNNQPVNSTYQQIAVGQAQTPAGGNAATAAGPQGLAFDAASGVLYETNDADNTLYAIPNAATATGPQNPTIVYRGAPLNSPENVVIDPVTGDLMVVNAGNNTLVEITRSGQLVATRNLAPGQPPGALFGLAVGTDANGNPVFYYDNDNTNTLHALVVPTRGVGYRLGAADGGVFDYGGAAFHGSAAGLRLNAPVVGMAATGDTRGYWLVAADGGVFTYGDAAFYGSAAGMRLNAPIVGMAATPDGAGYWLVASDGGVFTYGDAAFYGSAGGLRLNAPVVGMAATPDGGGYWLVAADGGVFTYGDAAFYGSAGGRRLNARVVGMAATPDGGGYWLVAADGGVFTYGDAAFYGSAGGLRLNAPVVGMAATPDGGGYWLVASDGGVFTYGDAAFYGSAAGLRLNAPVVGITAAL